VSAAKYALSTNGLSTIVIARGVCAGDERSKTLPVVGRASGPRHGRLRPATLL